MSQKNPSELVVKVVIPPGTYVRAIKDENGQWRQVVTAEETEVEVTIPSAALWMVALRGLRAKGKRGTAGGMVARVHRQFAVQVKS